jgi:hypothetical protein
LDSLQIKYIYNGLEFTETNEKVSAGKSELEKCRAYWRKRNKQKN